MTDTIGTTCYTRTLSGHLVSQRNANGATYYYLFDGLGSVIGMEDARWAIRGVPKDFLSAWHV